MLQLGHELQARASGGFPGHHPVTPLGLVFHGLPGHHPVTPLGLVFHGLPGYNPVTPSGLVFYGLPGYNPVTPLGLGSLQGIVCASIIPKG
jgi:hypothetical protein